MILFSIDVVMAPVGLAWEDVGARFSNVVSLISVGYWWQVSLRELELEVRSYKSSLLLNEEPERVVFLSVIEARSW